MKKLILGLFVLFAVSSCNKCKDYDCFTPPQEFVFQFVDSVTGTDLYATGILDTTLFDARDEENLKVIYKLQKIDSSVFFVFYSIGWNTGPHSYNLNLDSTKTVILNLNMEERYENCCTFYRRNNFNLQPYSWTESSSTGIFKVAIP